MIDLKEIFKKHEDEYLKSKTLGRKDLLAFRHLSELVPGNDDIIGSAEHDEIYLGIDCDKLAEVASEEDIKYLIQLGIRYDEDYDSLCMFV